MPRQTPPSTDPSDTLYALPLDDFVAARNRLAAELGQGGDKERAAAIKALAKPSLSAWAVNQVYWQARPLFEALAAASEAVRRAQGSELRAALEERRAALQAATRKAAEILGRAGGATSPETMRRIGNTLEAVTTLEPSPENRPGRLSRDVDPPGFDTLAGLAAHTAPSRVLQFRPAAPAPAAAGKTTAAAARRAEAERQAAAAAAQQALRDAEQTLRGARQEADKLRRAAARARDVAERAETERRGLEGKLAAATAAAQTRAREARQLEREVGAAEQTVAAAEVDVARARGRLPAS